MAAKKGYDAIVRQLLSSGATIDRRDEDSHTALDLAVLFGHRGVAQALVESKGWQKIMMPKDELPLGRHNKPRKTPLRDLLSKFPDVAKIVLSKCVTLGGKQPGEIRPSLGFIKELVGERSPYDHNGILKKAAKTYSDDYDFVFENHPLKLMAH
ncbi:hypothetical protein ANCCEY_14028 [Ancylostoma ceylanicum]|uniref:Uncharacterized protein n=1 Tax=Ancylostoma ceylanicum TaxID=53326 RepID=A0A0D6L685_9BILA|nr:hypothetical protein ANCCEY_14028 [Ancylostoma ceylanicum]